MFVDGVRCTHQHPYGSTVDFIPPLCRNLFEVFFSFGDTHHIQIPLTALPPHIVHADRRNRPDPRIDGCGSDTESAASANADGSDPVPVDERLFSCKIYGGAEIIHIGFGRCQMTRRTAALSAIRKIESEGDESAFGQLLGVETTRLLLDSAERMSDNNRRVFLRPVQIFRQVHICDDCNVVPVFERHLFHAYLIALRECFVPNLGRCRKGCRHRC